MQENHQKLKEEMIALKMQNLKLDEKVTKLKNKTKDLITITNEKMNMHKLTEPSRVVYDLTQNPPKVQYANDLFCNMLGYHAVGSISFYFFSIFLVFLYIRVSSYLVKLLYIYFCINFLNVE